MIHDIQSSIEKVPVDASLVSSDTLRSIIQAEYDMPALIQCRLWFVGTTDTYLVTTDQDCFILRLYETGTRTNDDVQYELAALHHLHQKGVSVALPIRRRDGKWFSICNAPEGPRQQVLFTYAPGREAYREAGYSERFGRSIAKLHSATDDFDCAHTRFHIDATILLERPLRWLQPIVETYATEWQELLAIANRLRQQLDTCTKEGLNWGFCHGDALGSNAHLEADTLTHFDFNDCGPGWRAYDLATFLWIKSWHTPQTVEAEWQEYLQAYCSIRQLASVDLDAISLFVALREFWVMGQQVYAAKRRGLWWVQDNYFAARIEFLHKWEQNHLVSS